ncbi:MAG: hypothetical protein JRF33_05110 [Deltaproteobacteria bacterium]|nr:hypothetical protein [Deltaproteobacteria bacterium]
MKNNKIAGLMMLFALGSLSASFAGCELTHGDGCPICYEDSCRPNGTCVMVNSCATCDCDEGYRQSEGLTCHQEPILQIGEACTDYFDCASGRCLKYTGDTEGYCTTTDCLTHDECVNHASGETAEMCCVEVDAAYFLCLKIEDGYACGDGTGTCGSACTGTGYSACDPRFPCVGQSDLDPLAVCSRGCETDDDCGVCRAPHLPDNPFSCVAISSGHLLCLPDRGQTCVDDVDCPDWQNCQQVHFPLLAEDPWLCVDNTLCKSPPDCPEGMSCQPTANPEDGSAGSCAPNAGADPVGTACDEDDDHCEVYCFIGLCTEACSLDEDCPEHMRCEVLRFSNVDDYMTLCMEDHRCNAPADCPDGESCWPTLADEIMEGWCRAIEGTDPLGTTCDENNDSCEVFCLDTRCTEWCSLNEDCPEDMRCGTIDFCITEPCDENMAPGSVCTGN